MRKRAVRSPRTARAGPESKVKPLWMVSSVVPSNLEPLRLVGSSGNLDSPRRLLISSQLQPARALVLQQARSVMLLSDLS